MKKRVFEFLPLFLFAIVGLLFYQFQPESADMPSAPVYDVSNFGNALVTRAVDGDTIVTAIDGMDDEVKIRLLGVNTPETVDPRRPVECFGKEASAFVKELLDGKRVRLEADPEADEQDRYGRLLRHVYLEDGTHVNALIVQEGYGFAYTSFPLNSEMKATLLALERDAKEFERGLWHPDACLDSIDN